MRITKKRLLIFLLMLNVFAGYTFRHLLFYTIITNPPVVGFWIDEISKIPNQYWKHLNLLKFRLEVSKSSTASDYDIKAYDDDTVIFVGSHGPRILYDNVDTKSFTTFDPNGYGYAKDKNYVYFSYGWTENSGPSTVIIVEGADLKTFTVIDNDTEARDVYSKYYKGERITDEELQRIRQLQKLQLEELLKSIPGFRSPR